MGKNDKVAKAVNEQGAIGWFMFLAYLGAVAYFFNLDPTFGGFIVALIKAIVWPAFVIYEVLGLLQIK